MEVITSTKNKWVRYVQKLHKPRQRKRQQQFILEGWHLVEEALNANATLCMVFVEASQWERTQAWPLSCPVHAVSSSVLKAMADTPTPQGIIAVVQMLEQPELETIGGSVLVLDRVQDPGNVGTMIRTADAAGYDAIVLSHDSADLYNAKVLRSTQGSLYHLPIIYTDLDEWIPQWLMKGTLYGTELNEEAVDYRTLSPTGNFAVIMGNEGQGVRSELLAQTTQNVYLPMRGQAESLNVAVATGILLFRWQ